MALRDFLDLLGERRLSGQMGPSRSLAQLQEDIDPETGAYNSPYLDTISGEPIDPTLFRDEIDVAGLAEGFEPVIPDIGNQGPPPGMTGSMMADFPDPPSEEQLNMGPQQPSAPIAPVQRGPAVSPTTAPLIDTSSLPTGSVNLELGSRGIQPAINIPQPDITGTGAEDPDSTMNRILRALSATGADLSGDLIGTRPPEYGERDLITKIAPLILGGGAAAGAAKAIPGIAKGGSRLWEQLLSMIRGSPRGAGGPARIGQQRALPAPSAANRPPGFTPPGSGRPISKPSPGNPPGRRRTSGTVPVLQ
jgi:hypothetical protein